MRLLSFQNMPDLIFQTRVLVKYFFILFFSILNADDYYEIRNTSHDFSVDGEDLCSSCHISSDMKIEEPSLLCLSCHDGVSGKISLNSSSSNPQNFSGHGNHPVSIKYTTGPSYKKITNKNLLKGLNGDMVECTSCHNPHQKKSDSSVNFLRYSMKNSELCYKCHNL